MAFDRMKLQCPKCGKWVVGMIAYRKHVGSKACFKAKKQNNKKDNSNAE